MSAATGPYLAFVSQYTPGEHGVLVVVDRGDGPEAEALVQLSRRPLGHHAAPHWPSSAKPYLSRSQRRLIMRPQGCWSWGSDRSPRPG